ncbi:MAG: carbohydrate kinase, partial [Bacilli bacterium]|nr:carbohydrate kinase [Bacilli bacterium]
MNEPLILTMDFGTQSVRVALFDKCGYMVAMKKKDYDQPYFSVKPNWAEKDPREYYKDLCQCTKELIKENPSSVGKIKGITLTCFRDTAVLLDSDMKVIRPSVLWLDQRNAKCEKPLPKLAQFLFKLVGKTDTINFNRRRCVANWIQENEKENWAKVYKYVPVSSYIHFLLTGELKDCASNCAGHYPIDFKNKKWYKKPEKHLTGQIFGLTR